MTSEYGNMKTIRSINGVVKELHAIDKDCAITVSCLRRLCDSGEIPYRMAGNRRLLAVEDVLHYFSGNGCGSSEITH